MKILMSTTDMTREQWLSARKNGIGGSEIAGLMGYSPFTNAYKIWKTKMDGEVQDNDNERMYWGRKLEDVVAEEFTERTGLKIRKKNAILQSKELPYMLANIDRLIVGQDVGLEVKTTSEYQRSEWEDNIPYHYFLQIQHYMYVTGFEGFYLAVLIGGNTFIHKYVERDEETIEMIVNTCKSFWQNHVLTKIPPQDVAFVNEIYPISSETEMSLSADTEGLIEAIEEKKAVIKKLEGELEVLENKVKAELKQHQTGIGKKYKAEWKTVYTKRFDSKAFQKDNERLYNAYLLDSNYRKFSIKATKNKK